jgi:hypothetical protein
MEEYIDTANYLRGLTADTHPLLAEYYDSQQKFRYYWEGSESAVFNMMPHFESIRLLYTEWQDAPDERKKYLTEESFELKSLISTLKKVRLAIRKQDKLLDRFLVRWGIGGISTPQHPDNVVLFDEDTKKGGRSRFHLHNYDWRIEDMQ